MFLWFELFSLEVQFYRIDGRFEAVILTKKAKRPIELKNSIKKQADKTEIQVKRLTTQRNMI